MEQIAARRQRELEASAVPQTDGRTVVRPSGGGDFDSSFTAFSEQKRREQESQRAH